MAGGLQASRPAVNGRSSTGHGHSARRGQAAWQAAEQLGRHAGSLETVQHQAVLRLVDLLPQQKFLDVSSLVTLHLDDLTVLLHILDVSVAVVALLDGLQDALEVQVTVQAL